MLGCAALGVRSAPPRTFSPPRGVADRCGVGPRRIQPRVSHRKRDGAGLGRVALRHHRRRNGGIGRLDRHHLPGLARLLQLEAAAAGLAGGAGVQGLRPRPRHLAPAGGDCRVADGGCLDVVGDACVRARDRHRRRVGPGHLLRLPLRPLGAFGQFRRAAHAADPAHRGDAVGVARPSVAAGLARRDRGAGVHGQGYGHRHALPDRGRS